MAENKKDKKKITKKLLNKYRLVILNEDTFEERLSFKLSRLNVFVLVGSAMVILIVLTAVLIAFTPLREYMPGYSSTKLRHQAVSLVYKTDSLEHVIDEQNRYFSSIQQTFSGDSLRQEANVAVDNPDPVSQAEVNLSPSEIDSTMRLEVEHNEKYNVFSAAAEKSKLNFFAPVKGDITDPYDLEAMHYGIDISITKNQPVKATADGTVIFAEWTSETGNVIILEHGFGWISVYKHNSSLNKQQGDHVKGGEVIAMTGNTGEFTTGPHLHFELWRDDYSVDPSEFIDFE